MRNAERVNALPPNKDGVPGAKTMQLKRSRTLYQLNQIGTNL